MHYSNIISEYALLTNFLSKGGNIIGKPVNYVFIEVNRAFEKLIGLKGKEVIGKNVTAVLTGTRNDPASWIAKYGNVGLGGK